MDAFHEQARGISGGGHLPPRVWGKRSFDVIVATLGLVALSPILAAIAIAVRLTSPGPVIYRGTRVGKGGRNFEILKFRSMWDRPTRQLTTALGDLRITPVGRRLRRYKLDELPQLINVVRGEMSIVGPRPEFQEWVDLYGPQDRRCLLVRPGITDFASLEFIDLDKHVGALDADERYLRDAFAQKNELRVRYVNEMSWPTDMKIIARPIGQLVNRS
jgi:lipopolysaccharide/colanic/teichoic acid biosynthesis glycosyltransferase